MAKQEKEKGNQKHFWKDFKAELKKVIWPTKKQLVNNTIVVIGMVLVTTIIVLVLDLVFEALNTYGINKIKKSVQDSISTTVDEESNSEDEHNHEEEQNTENTENQTTGEETNTASEDNNQTTEQE